MIQYFPDPYSSFDRTLKLKVKLDLSNHVRKSKIKTSLVLIHHHLQKQSWLIDIDKLN